MISINKMNDYIIYVILLLILFFVPLLPQPELLTESFAVSTISTMH